MEERRVAERRLAERRKPWGMTSEEAWTVAREIESLVGGEATPQPFKDLQGGYRISYTIRGDTHPWSRVITTVEEGLAFAATKGRTPKTREYR